MATQTQMNLLVCGGAGFIGSNFIRYIRAKYPEYRIVNFDKLSYAGNLDNLKGINEGPTYAFYKGDIADATVLDIVIAKEKINAIVNFAAETHVDRSIHMGSREFVMSNVVGVQTILDAVRKNNIPRYLQVSTDEVFGSLELDNSPGFTENTPFEPNSPYSAAKAGGDFMCRAYFSAFQTPVMVTHCSNNYGPYCFPEKLIPFFVLKAMKGEPLTLYGDGKNVRDWLYVEDHASALDAVLHNGKPGEVYNIGGNTEKSNLEIAKLILAHFKLNESLIQFVKDRPGHDRRYAIDASKIKRELGWEPKHKFEEALTSTIEWYVNNPDWIKAVTERNAEINSHI